MMGLKESVYWCSWLCSQLILNLTAILLFLSIAYFLQVFHLNSLFICFLVFFFYASAMVSMSFFFSVFFSQPKTATTFAWFFFFIQLVISAIFQYFLFKKDDFISYFLVYSFSLFFPPIPLGTSFLFIPSPPLLHLFPPRHSSFSVSPLLIPSSSLSFLSFYCSFSLLPPLLLFLLSFVSFLFLCPPAAVLPLITSTQPIFHY